MMLHISRLTAAMATSDQSQHDPGVMYTDWAQVLPDYKRVKSWDAGLKSIYCMWYLYG